MSSKAEDTKNPEKQPKSALDDLKNEDDEVELEPISLEELKEINGDINTKFVEASKEKRGGIKQALNIITTLSRKLVTAKLIKESGIGRTLTKLSQIKKEDFLDDTKEESYNDDIIKDKTENLINQFKAQIKVAEMVQKSKEEKKWALNVKIPYFPQAVKDKMEDKNEPLFTKVVTNLVTTLQTLPEDLLKQNGPLGKKDILKGAEVGLEIGEYLMSWSNGDKQKLTSKLSTLKVVITQINKQLHLSLLKGLLSVESFVKMEEKEMATKETQAIMAEKMMKEVEQNRTDGMAIEAQKNKHKSLIQCNKCKSNNVTFYLQQTRSADEPMTQFCTCMECGKQWKI